MRIAYCIDNLAGNGGMERMITSKANYLSQQFGYEVSIISASQNGRKSYFPLCDDVRLIDLGVVIDGSKQCFKLWRKRLEEHLYSHPYDIAISTGGHELGFLYKIKDNSVKIAEYHFSYDTNAYWAQNIYSRRYGKLLAWTIGKYKTIRTICQASHYRKFIVLSRTDCAKWSKHMNNCIFIYDFINVNPSFVEYDPSIKRVITAGRHDTQKGYDYMMEAWAIVKQSHPDWHLYIYGGGDPTETATYIRQHSLEDVVHIMGFTEDMDKTYHDAAFFILSSRAEGFGLVLAEAQACGLPVVTFDTPIGPAEIVNDGTDGFIISQVGNTKIFAKKMISLIENENLRMEMSKNSIKNANRFNRDIIMTRWNSLFISLMRSK
ncbi:MAG: glycosyltransferase family 4 protein [Muribaculaceae bacterium]